MPAQTQTSWCTLKRVKTLNLRDLSDLEIAARIEMFLDVFYRDRQIKIFDPNLWGLPNIRMNLKAVDSISNE